MTNLVFTLVIVLLTNITYAQNAKDFFSNEAATLSFVGLDFSLAKMVATGESSSKNKEMYEVWNGMMAKEADKFEVHKVFERKGEPILNLEITDVINKKVKEDNINVHSDPTTRFDAKRLQKMARKYNLKKITTQYTMSFIIHSFSKTDKKAIIYVVLMNTKNKKVLWSEVLETEPSGLGYRNYWVNSVYDAIKAVKRNYKKWAEEIS